ncbi:MAG: DUF308 domain-containing protein, partial [Candidatus Thorarchaeota archaeon]
EVETKIPLWLRIYYIFAGILSILFSTSALFNIKFDYIEMNILLGIILISIGITRVIVGVGDKDDSKWLRLFNLIAGILLLPDGIIAIINPTSSINILYVMLSLALIVLGFVEIYQGFISKNRKTWYRIFLIFYGLILWALAILVLSTSSWAEWIYISLLCTGFIIIGLRRLTEGIIGHITKIAKVEATGY